MEATILLALAFSITIFLTLGFVLAKNNRTLADVFPIFTGRKASVRNTDEFSSSTTATTVSLATIILAYYQLIGYFGLWLLWTAITTAIGMGLVSVFASRIWNKMSKFDHRPTLHEYLGAEYDNKTISIVGALCTSFGYLLIFATELIVGSTFLAGLLPQIPFYLTVVVLSGIGVTYVIYGGFRSVIKTDQWQMKFIWGFILALLVYFTWYVMGHGGLSINLQKIPVTIYNFSPRAGLGIFILGLTIMNIPTHISSMAVFQRIAGAEKLETVVAGFKRSVWGISFSWGLIVILAALSFMIVPAGSTNLLTDLLKIIGSTFFGRVILFFVVVGMYSALLSTSSTNLVAVGQTVSEDIIARFKKATLIERDNSPKEFWFSRFILFVCALVSIFIVVGLKQIGFDIKDLVFSIYGGALALFPPILLSLFQDRGKLKRLSSFASAGIILGFVCGWGAAFYGKLNSDNNLIFLSPTISISVSFACLLVGYIFRSRN